VSRLMTRTRICAGCEGANPESARFCRHCGLGLELISATFVETTTQTNLTCPKCGTENRSTARFCRKCGADLIASALRSEPRPLPSPSGLLKSAPPRPQPGIAAQLVADASNNPGGVKPAADNLESASPDPGPEYEAMPGEEAEPPVVSIAEPTAPTPARASPELLRTCSACGAEDVASAHFCRGCGTPAPAKVPRFAPAVRVLGARRRGARSPITPRAALMVASIVVLLVVGVLAYGVVHHVNKPTPVASASVLPQAPSVKIAPQPSPPSESSSAVAQTAASEPAPTKAARMLVRRPKAHNAPATSLAVTASAPPPAVPVPEPAPAATPLINDPVWLRRPSGQEAADLYPSQAQEDNVEGEASIDCAVSGDGRLYDCAVVSEHPAGKGFGRATLSLTSRFRMRSTTESGHAVAGHRVRVPVRWRLAQ
jgi:protein TonB